MIPQEKKPLVDMEKDNTGRIPRELMHEQNDRLSSKHIQTLGFLQEVVNENRALKQKVQELEVKNTISGFQDITF